MNSFKSHAVLDVASRKKKARKIIAVLSLFKNLKKLSILDIGTGNGMITSELGKHAQLITGVDVIDERIVKDFKFKVIKDDLFPFKNKTFDGIISNHVIEHVEQKEKHIQEMYRILKEDGICYLATPNKYAFLEPHYKLPFLSYFPRLLASCYTFIFKRCKYDVTPLSHRKLVKALSPYFYINDLTIQVIKHPERFDIHYPLASVIKRIPAFCFKILQPFFPTYIFVLEKRSSTSL